MEPVFIERIILIYLWASSWISRDEAQSVNEKAPALVGHCDKMFGVGRESFGKIPKGILCFEIFPIWEKPADKKPHFLSEPSHFIPIG